MSEVRERDSEHGSSATPAATAVHRNALTDKECVAGDTSGLFHSNTFGNWVERADWLAVQVLERDRVGRDRPAVVRRFAVVRQAHHVAHADVPQQLPINACRKTHADEWRGAAGDEVQIGGDGGIAQESNFGTRRNQRHSH